MKILVLADDFPPDALGGAGIVAFRLAQEYARQGHEVRVLATTTKKEHVGTRVVSDGVVSHVFSRYHERWRSYMSLWNPSMVREILRVVREFAPDVVNAHNIHFHISYAALIAARRCGVRVFMTAHDIISIYPSTFTAYINQRDLSCPATFNYRVTWQMAARVFRLRYNPFRNWYIRSVLRRIDGVIAVSDALKDALTQNDIPVRAVIRNGIDVAGWQVRAEDIEHFKKMHNLSGRDIILFGGRLSGAKGGDVILQALKIVVEKNKNAVLVVAGRTGAYSDTMKRRAAELGVAQNLVFTGWLDEAESKKAYGAATVVVVPSVCFDSFPTNNLEAFAAHKPVVATCFGGSREIVRDGENGRIVNPFNVSALAAALAECVSDSALVQRYGEAGYRLVVTEYSIVEMAKKYIALFSTSSA